MLKNITPLKVIDYRTVKDGIITEPGIYSNVPSDVYHRKVDLFGMASDGRPVPHLSSGIMRRIEDPDNSMAHIWDECVLNPKAQAVKDKATWIKGRAAHTLLLGEHSFREEYEVRPDSYPDGAEFPSIEGAPKPWNGNAKWCKAWLAAAELKRKAVLKLEDVQDIRGMAEALAAHPTIQTGLLNGLVEKSIFWPRKVVLEDGREVTIWLKARPDNIPTDSNMISDLKGCESAGPGAVRMSISSYGYEQQLSLASEGLLAVAGREMTEHVLVFVEWSRPHAINIKPLNGDAINWGHCQNERALRKFAKCWADNEWPGYDDDEVSCGITERKVERLKAEQKAGLLPDLADLDARDEAAAEAV